jgi:hypothetical protein
LFLYKLSVSLAVVWGFYQVVLRRLTFHRLNRWYLLGYSLLSFLIPFINIGPMLASGPTGEQMLLRYIPAIGGGGALAGAAANAVAVNAGRAPGISGWTILLAVLVLGALLLLVRLGLRWISLVQLRRKARLVEGMGVRIYQVEGRITPFSFGNAIYINQALHTEKEWEDIILHEYVHIRQRHTADILIAELLCIFNWYNPIAWLIRHSIKQNLEFIADQSVLDKGVDRKDYQYHLLKVVGEPQYRLANNFNFPSLKRRIVMMNKLRSARAHLLKLLFLLPLLALLLTAFRDRYAGWLGSHGQIYVNTAGIVVSLPDQIPLEGAIVRERISGLETTTDENGFYKLKIPATANASLRMHLTFTKEGYDSTYFENFMPVIKETKGLLVPGGLVQKGVQMHGVFIVGAMPNSKAAPADPGFADALENWERVKKTNEDLNRFMRAQKEHPEVSLFYETEDHQKEIVIHTDGTIERFGFAGSPALGELHQKYGDIQGFLATDHPEAPMPNSGYLARWAAIGAEAEKEFHTTNKDVRAIIFPGDSRVIAVPVSGKPKVYDMDNDADVERAEFERLYGKLPACVPGAGANTDEIERSAGRTPRHGARLKDTLPGGRSGAGKQAGQGAVMAMTQDTLKDRPRGNVGVIYHPDTLGGITNVLGRPLMIVDGREEPYDSLRTLNPDRIASINVLKDSAAESRYGEKGRAGVLIIALKH